MHNDDAGAGLISVPSNLSASGCGFVALNTIGSRIQANSSEHNSDCLEESHWVNKLHIRAAPDTPMTGSIFHIIQRGVCEGQVYS